MPLQTRADTPDAPHRSSAPQRQAAHAIAGVRHVLAVSSGKGGVGKSTTAMNLALALSDAGARVGLLDADIHGPSVPMMMGMRDAQPEHLDGGKSMKPVWAHGVQLMSIGFLTDDDGPVIWRGAAASQMIEQLMRQTAWDALDYLVVDMPPGTGDVPLTLCQRAPISGAVIVTTPQDVALLDVIKGIRLFEKAGVPVLGAIENMAVHVCKQCGNASHPFGEGGGERLYQRTGVPLLASMPLDRQVREQADGGMPMVRSHPASDMAHRYRLLAQALHSRIHGGHHVAPPAVIGGPAGEAQTSIRIETSPDT